MRMATASACIFLLWLAATIIAAGQTMAARLQTADTVLQFEAAKDAPRLTTLASPGQPAWTNLAPESLIPSAEINGQSTALHWRLNQIASSADSRKVAFVYETESPHLRLTWEWQARDSRGPIEHQIRIENLERGELWLPLQPSLQVEWRIAPQSSLEHIYIEKGADTPSDIGTHQVEIPAGYQWHGDSSTYAHPKEGEPREIIPWTLVENSDAKETAWYVGIEFSGRTRLTLERTAESLKAVAGLNPEPGAFRTRLEPGESFLTPIVFVGASQGGIDSATNILRRWIRNVLANPAAWKNPNYPLLVNNSWGGGMKVNQHVARSMIRDAADLGLEMFHLDAGWFRGVGDWYPDPEKFPQGLAPVADDAHRHGLRFGLWVDWTQAGLDSQPGALNANDPKVRDWMVTDLPAGWKPEEFKGQTIDLGVPAAKDWAEHEVERIVSNFHLDMLEHDGYLVAQGCDRSDHPHAPPDNWNKCIYKAWGSYWVDSSNSTDVSYHAVRAYYDIYSDLRRRHPSLLLEVCDDGGRMIDFGSAAHADYFSITDTYDPVSNRRAFYDASYVLPSAMLESYVERWPAPHLENFRYMLRSGMMGWLTIMIDTNAWSAEEHAAAKEEIQLYKSELRPLIRDANLYHISDRPDGVHWDGMEYFDPRSQRGVMYAFRGSTNTEPTHRFFLKGLAAEAMYRLHFHDRSSPDRTVIGHELLTSGLEIALPTAYNSELVFIESVPSQ
jgi:hypothetical protein